MTVSGHHCLSRTCWLVYRLQAYESSESSSERVLLGVLDIFVSFDFVVVPCVSAQRMYIKAVNVKSFPTQT